MTFNLKNFISNFNIKDIKGGDTIITKSNGTFLVDNILEYGWDYNYGNLIWFQDGNRSINNKDLLQRNERNSKR